MASGGGNDAVMTVNAANFIWQDREIRFDAPPALLANRYGGPPTSLAVA